MEEKTPPLIGREEEKKLLHKLLHSKEAVLLAIYGRRRVGKTYLVRQFFKDKGIFFEVTGSYNANPSDQLENFHSEYCALFKDGALLPQPKTWKEALMRLKKSIIALKSTKKIILFFDELPWLASGCSNFLEQFEYMWNRHFSQMSNVFMILSGSAASWMLSNVINNIGGLYGRLSMHMKLTPFTLAETESYFKANGIDLPRKQICEIYMVTGGVPKYLSYVSPGLSSAQIIHSLCFTPQSVLLTEFHKLYHSLFRNAQTHLNVVEALAKKRRGMRRSELLKMAKLSNNGKASEILRELEESGFILTIAEHSKTKKDMRYYLYDEYTLFYLSWIAPEKSELLNGVEKDYWIKKQMSTSWKSWSGFAFEALCYKHLKEIKEHLRIGSVSTKSGYWQLTSKGKKVIEIDLVIDRADQCANLCEMKFSNKPFVINKSYADELRTKKAFFQEQTRKALFTTMITPHGVKENTAYLNSVDHQLTLDALF